MATDVERLAVLIEAQTKSYENAMLRLESKTQKAIRAATGSINSLDKQMASLGRRAEGILAIFGVGFSLRGAQGLLDASTRIENSLKVAGLAGDDLKRVYDSLYDSARRNAAPLEALTQLYGRAALVQKDLGATTEDMLKFTDKVALALRVSGQSAEQSSGALLQLSQALGSGTVRAEEFNSILEGALPIAQAAAAGLREAGGSVAQLRTLVVEGKVSSKAFFDAFLAGSTILDQKVAGSQLTVAQGFENLKTAAINAVGQLDKVVGASLGAATGLGAIAGALDGLASHQDQLKTLVEWMERLAAAYAGARLGGALLGKKGAILGAGIGLLEPEIRKWAADQGLLPGGNPSSYGGTPAGWTGTPILPAGLTPPANANAPAAPQPVSLGDYGAPGGADTKAVERQQKTYEKLAASLSLAQANLTATDREQAIANDLAKLGTDATEKQRNSIALLSGQLYDQQKALQQFNDTAQYFGESINDALGDLIFRGKSASDVLADLVEKLGEAALQATLLGTGPLAALFGTAPATTGGLGGLLGTLFGGFRAGGGSVDAGKAYMVGEKGPELFIPKTGGMVAANGNRPGGGVTVVQNFTFTNADPSIRPWITGQMAQVKAIAAANAQAGVRIGRRNNPGYFS